jgi:hypothetical protein
MILSMFSHLGETNEHCLDPKDGEARIKSQTNGEQRCDETDQGVGSKYPRPIIRTIVVMLFAFAEYLPK